MNQAEEEDETRRRHEPSRSPTRRQGPPGKDPLALLSVER
jgi:hypothetical protein